MGEKESEKYAREDTVNEWYGAICAALILLAIIAIIAWSFRRSGKKAGYREGWADAMGPMKGVVMMAMENEE